MTELFTFSEKGGHLINEDAFLIEPHPSDSSLLICALADGQGGRRGGSEAAQIACHTVVERAQGYSPKQLTKSNTWLKIVGTADSAVQQFPEAGFTTLVGLAIIGDELYGASSGDSAALVLNVHDQRHLLTENQQKNPPVGSGIAQFVPFQVQLIEPWLVLLISDGVWKYIGWNSVHSLIARHKGAALIPALKDEARATGGGFRDDFTVVAIYSSEEFGDS